MLHYLGSFAVVVGLLYVLLCLYLYLMQEKLLFYPNLPGRELGTTPADFGLAYESVYITTADGILLHGWFLKAGRERGTLLFFHGNAGNISHRLDSLRIFNTLGLSVLIIDYRGYGQSGGKITEEGTYRDADAAWQYLTGPRNIDPGEIILFGRSLGGAIAAHLAAKEQPAALILESVFSSVPDVAAGFYPFIPVRLLARFNYDTRKALASVSCPVLVIHSPDDEIIPFENGRILFAAAREPKSFLEIKGGHNEGFLISGPRYIKALEEFVNTVFPERSKEDELHEDIR